MKIPIKQFSVEAIKIFMDYDWPGNVRELRNYITRAVILSKEEIIKPIHLEQKITAGSESYPLIDKTPKTWIEMDEMRKEVADKASRLVEKRFISELLKKFDGNVSRAAEYTGINRTNLHKMIKRCGL